MSADVDAAREALMSAIEYLVDRPSYEPAYSDVVDKRIAFEAAIRAEGLDVALLENALAKYGIHIDVNPTRKHEVPCESCQAALSKVAAEYARLAEADR